MEPRVQWARTSDGVSIGFTTAGSGAAVPLLWLPPISWSHARLAWDVPNWALQFERIAARRPFACLDYRGQGLSDRTPPSYSIDAFVLDVEAVVSRLGWHRFAIYGHLRGSLIALSYAHRHAAAVAGLILDGAMSRATDEPPEPAALTSLRERSWDMYVDALAHLGLGWDRSAEARAMADLFRVATTQDASRAAHLAIAGTDLSAILPQLAMPVLILQRLGDPFARTEAPQRVAGLLSDARAVVLRASLPGPDDIEFEDGFIEEFLDELSAPGSVEAVGSHSPVACLSPRELEVLQLIVSGSTNREIAAALDLSPRTVARHIANIYDKIDARGKAEAAAYALRHGLIS